jgi:hypothetical protein
MYTESTMRYQYYNPNSYWLNQGNSIYTNSYLGFLLICWLLLIRTAGVSSQSNIGDVEVWVRA